LYGNARFGGVQFYLALSINVFYYLQASSKRFSPTRLATTLTSLSPPLPSSHSTGGSGSADGTGTVALSSGAAQQGFIVLETNYRVYAYTGMLLQCQSLL